MSRFDESLMYAALDAAKRVTRGDLPVGAALFDGSGDLLAAASNSVQADSDMLAHAEMNLLRSFGALRVRHSPTDLTLAVTLEPCPMCAWAIRDAGIKKLIFGASNPRYGAAGSAIDLLRDTRFGPQVEVMGGVLELPCSELLQEAFRKMRDN